MTLTKMITEVALEVEKKKKICQDVLITSKQKKFLLYINDSTQQVNEG